jgi:hypothetical protein
MTIHPPGATAFLFVTPEAQKKISRVLVCQKTQDFITKFLYDMAEETEAYRPDTMPIYAPHFLREQLAESFTAPVTIQKTGVLTLMGFSIYLGYEHALVMYDTITLQVYKRAIPAELIGI